MELSISEPVQKHSVGDQSSKRKKQTLEQSGEHSEEEEDVCKVVLKTGRRKGKKCGRLNCTFHSLTDANEKSTKRQKK